MKKDDLINEIARRADFFKQDVSELVQTLIEVIKDALVRGETVKVNGFIIFEPIDIPERTVMNPKTQQDCIQKAHTKIKATVSPVLIEVINSERKHFLESKVNEK